MGFAVMVACFHVTSYEIGSFVVMVSIVPRYKTHPTKTLGWGTLRVFSISMRRYFGRAVLNVYEKSRRES